MRGPGLSFLAGSAGRPGWRPFVRGPSSRLRTRAVVRSGRRSESSNCHSCFYATFRADPPPRAAGDQAQISGVADRRGCESTRGRSRDPSVGRSGQGGGPRYGVVHRVTASEFRLSYRIRLQDLQHKPSMLRLDFLSLLAILIVPAALSAQATADSGSFVVRHAGDTVAIERFSRTGIKLEGTLALRNPKKTSEHYSALIAPDATLPLIEVTVRQGVSHSPCWSRRCAGER